MSEPRIAMTGLRFGRLMVTGYAGLSAGAKARHLWSCLCDCGGETVACGTSLRRGKTSSCGCLQREKARQNKGRNPLQLVGQVFGRLTVAARDGSDVHGRAMWRCACECGGSVVVASRNLVGGFTKSCGCYRSEWARAIQPSGARCFAGAKFGKLTLLEVTGRRSDQALWRCACECGGEKIVTGSSLRKGHAKSCGCLRPGPKPKPDTKRRQPRSERTTAPKATRMSVKPERRTADGSNSIGAWPKTAPKKVGPADSRPAWRPQSEYKPLSEPAQRATGRVTVCPAPKFNHRYGVDPNKVTPMFSALKPGQYLEVAA